MNTQTPTGSVTGNDSFCPAPAWTTVIIDSRKIITGIVHPQANALLPFATENPVGMHIGELENQAPDEYKEPARILARQITKAYDQRRNVCFEYDVRLPEGRTACLICHAESQPGAGVCVRITEVDQTDLEEIRRDRREETEPDKDCRLLETIYENLPIGFELYDKGGRMTGINAADLKLLGVKDKDSMLGISLFNEPNIPDEIKERIRNGEDVRFITEYDFDRINTYYPTGLTGCKTIEMNAVGVRNAAKETDHYLLMLQDITDKISAYRSIEESRMKFEYLFNSIEAGVEYYDTKGNLVETNQYMVHLLGMKDKETLIAAASNLFSKRYLSEEVREMIRRGRKSASLYWYDFDDIVENKVYETERRGKTPLQIRTSPILNKDGELTGTILTMTDITENVQLRENLERAIEASESAAWALDLGTQTFSALYGRTFPENGTTFKESLAQVHPDDQPLYIACIEAISSGRKDHDEIVLRFRTPGEDGYRHIENRMGVRKSRTGVASHITGIQRDITEKSILESNLESARKSLGLAMDATDLTAWDYNTQTRQYRILHGGRIFSTETDILSQIHPHDREKYERHTQCIFNGEKSRDAAIIRIRGNGKEFRYYESTISSVRDAKGTLAHLIGSMKNITASVSSEMELKKQKDIISLALEAGDMAVWIYDTASETFSSLEGEALAGKGLPMSENLAQMHPEDAAVFPEQFRSILEGRVPKLYLQLRYRHEGTEGGYRYYESSVIPVRDEQGRITHLTGTQKDVTDLYFKQEELQQSKLKTDLAIRTADIVLWEYDCRDHLFTCYNEPLNGYDESNKLSMDDYMAFIHPDDRETTSVLFRLMETGKDESFDFDLRMRATDDSEWQYYGISGSPFRKNENGRVIKYAGFRRNNTELEKQKALLRTVLDNVPVPIYIKDVKDSNRFVFWNNESTQMFGENQGGTTNDFLGKEKTEHINRIDREVMETGKTYLEQEKITLLNGHEFETIVQKSVVHVGDRDMLLVVRWDIGQQNELQRKSKLLSTSMNALKAYTWYYNSEEQELIFGDGFDNTGGDRKALNSMPRFAEQIHPDDRDRFLHFINRFMQQNEGEFAVEYRIDLANTGRYEWWECRGTMETTLKNNEPYKSIYGMDINIDRHKQNEQALLEKKSELAELNRQNELILNNTNSGLAYISVDYIVQWENISVCSSGLSAGAYKKGERCYEAAHNRTSPCENCVMQQAMRTKQTERIAFDSDNGKTTEVFAIPVFRDDGELDGAVIRVDDITEHRQMITDLQKAKRQAEQSDKLKSAFLANMSHEIRTPLNAIVGFSELLINSDDPDEKEEFTRIINTNNELLLKLINDILDLSKIEAGFIGLKCRTFDLAEYFNEVSLAMQHKISRPEIRFIAVNPYSSCIVESDKNRLTQIWTNYVTNAIKYTEKGFIEMGYEYIDGGIRLYVKDSGIGISEEKKEKVFRRFEKLDEFAQGTGLGLSICKAIADAFQGKVGFESEADKGSVFWAWLPCKAERIVRETAETGRSGETETWTDKADDADGNMRKQQKPEHRKRILVAEDIQSNYLLISAFLKKEYELERAADGREAVEKAKTGLFDLILMDMKMPVMDGLEAIAHIRGFDREIPIVALTAHAFESDREAALEAGCNDYLAKPVNKAKLTEVLRRFLG